MIQNNYCDFETSQLAANMMWYYNITMQKWPPVIFVTEKNYLTEIYYFTVKISSKGITGVLKLYFYLIGDYRGHVKNMKTRLVGPG